MGISCEKSRFYVKKSYFFSNFRGGAPGAPLDMEPLNVSDHTLVIAELKGEIIRKHRKLTTIMKRPNWRKCDKDLYKETLAQSLN